MDSLSNAVSPVGVALFEFLLRPLTDGGVCVVDMCLASFKPGLKKVFPHFQRGGRVCFAGGGRSFLHLILAGKVVRLRCRMDSPIAIYFILSRDEILDGAFQLVQQCEHLVDAGVAIHNRPSLFSKVHPIATAL
ncbi:MAG: hypothetical protein WCS42_04420 [Verrucomicrobiota bacterium]